jgi:ankyrin repeat protein
MAEVRVNLPDSLRGHTALTAAATAGHLDICRILLRRGASPAVTNLTVSYRIKLKTKQKTNKQEM